MAVSQINEANYFSISRLAELFGHTRETVSKKIREGGLQPVAKRSGHPVYRLRDVAVLTGGIPSPDATPFESCDPNKLPPKERDAWYSSENRRIQFEISQKQLIKADEAGAKIAETFKKVALAVDTLADVLERDVGLTPEQIQRINSITDGIRTDLANSLTANIGVEQVEEQQYDGEC